MDRMAAMRLVDAGLWDAKEVEALYRAFNKIRAKDGHRKKAANPKTRHPSLSDFYRYFRLDASSFLQQVLLMPKRVPLEGLDPGEVDKVSLSFPEFALAVWLLCAFELATLAFSMMDTDQKGYLTRYEVRRAVAEIYSIHNSGPRVVDGVKPVDLKLQKIMQSLDADNSGTISRAEFLAFSHQHHHMLLPAFAVQRSVRERVFGQTFRWAAVERKRQKLVGQRTIQAVVDDIARLVPEIGGGSTGGAGEGDAYLHETDADKVLDHAAAAYKNGDMRQAKKIYDYHAGGGGATNSNDSAVRKSTSVSAMTLDSTKEAAREGLRRKKERGAHDRAFAGRRFSEEAYNDKKISRGEVASP